MKGAPRRAFRRKVVFSVSKIYKKKFWKGKIMLDEEIKIEDKIEELLRMTADKRYRELKLQLVEMNEVDIASFI